MEKCLMYRAMSKDLGIIFLSDLTFRTHYGNIIPRGYKSIDLIRRISKFLKDKNTFEILYSSLIVNWPDVLEYDSIPDSLIVNLARET